MHFWFRSLTLGALSALLTLTACSHAPSSAPPPQKNTTMVVVAPALYTEHSYRGKPDLGLTLAIVQAGGGANHFDSARLYRVLAGPHAQDEFKKLQSMYGKAKMDAFMQTFTYAVHDLVALFALNHIALPDQPSVSPRDGAAITTAIYRDGVMPTGKYDCGYMMEHLMTHPVHVVLMHDINVAHGHGPAHNANFHLILTRMIADLRDQYQAKGGSV